MKIRVRFAMISLMALLLSSCISSRITESWHESDIVRGTIQRIMVVAIMKDEMRRRIWEDEFIKNLSPAGLEVVPSYKVFEKNAPKEDELRKYVESKSFQGVLMIRKVGEINETFVVPGKTTIRQTPMGYGRGSYWGYYGESYEIENTPGYMGVEKKIFYESTLLDVTPKGDGKLIWKGKSESIDPSSRQTMTEELARLFVNRLHTDGLF